jgi:hypothetical protein
MGNGWGNRENNKKLLIMSIFYTREIDLITKLHENGKKNGLASRFMSIKRILLKLRMMELSTAGQSTMELSVELLLLCQKEEIRGIGKR